MANKEPLKVSAGASQTFTLRNNDPEEVLRQTTATVPLGRTESVFETHQAKKKQIRQSVKGKKTELWKRKESDKKRRVLEVDSEDCLRIEFAELLAEPANKYIPSLHGWRDWAKTREWIDPDGARVDAVNAVETRCQELPSKKYGPPLP